MRKYFQPHLQARQRDERIKSSIRNTAELVITEIPTKSQALAMWLPNQKTNHEFHLFTRYPKIDSHLRDR
jgi:hypothetical protein